MASPTVTSRTAAVLTPTPGVGVRTGERGWASRRVLIWAAPTAALLGRFDAEGQLQYVGRTTVLNVAARQTLASELQPGRPGHPWTGWTFSAGWGSRQQLQVRLVEPVIVAEVAVTCPWTRRGGGGTLSGSCACAPTSRPPRSPCSKRNADTSPRLNALAQAPALMPERKKRPAGRRVKDANPGVRFGLCARAAALPSVPPRYGGPG